MGPLDSGRQPANGVAAFPEQLLLWKGEGEFDERGGGGGGAGGREGRTQTLSLFPPFSCKCKIFLMAAAAQQVEGEPVSPPPPLP